MPMTCILIWREIMTITFMDIPSGNDRFRRCFLLSAPMLPALCPITLPLPPTCLT